MTAVHLLRQYWDWAGSNIGAMPACGLIAAVSAAAFRRPLARLWHRLIGEHPAIAEIRRAANAAQQIAADLYEHHTGQPHELASPPGNEKRG